MGFAKYILPPSPLPLIHKQNQPAFPATNPATQQAKIAPCGRGEKADTTERRWGRRGGSTDLEEIDCSTRVPYSCGPWSQRLVHFTWTYLAPLSLNRPTSSCLSVCCSCLFFLFLDGFWHVVTVFFSFFFISYIISSDERLFLVRAELSRAEHAAELSMDYTGKAL